MTALVARSEDVLLAAVAYTRTEMRTLDALIALRSQGALRSTTSATTTTTFADLPPELLLRIRSHLHTVLRSHVAAEAKVALTKYEAALVEGLCADCFGWNADVYGEDVWAWVESGYRGACACVVGSTKTCTEEGGKDPRVPSAEKQQVEKLYEGLTIGNRAQWLRAYISRMHPTAAAASSVTGFARAVLASLGCEEERRQHRRRTSADFVPPAPQALTPSEEVAAELKKAARGNAPAGFGSLVCIKPAEARAKREEPCVTLARLQRELDIPSSTEEPSIIPEPSSAAQYAHLVYSPAACSTAAHFHAQRIAAVCESLEGVRTVLAMPVRLATYALARTNPSAAGAVACAARSAKYLAVAGAVMCFAHAALC